MSDNDGFRFNVRSSLLAQISKAQDESMRTVLLLMLGILDEIGSKIDSRLADEDKLRATVLNGHSDRHSEHHDWVEERLRVADETEDLVARAKPVLVWCEGKIAEEREFRKANRSTARKLLDKALEQIVTIAITAAATTIVITLK